MWCCYLIPIIFGIIILINGQVMLTYNRKVRGVPARIIGILLLLPLPLTFLMGLLLGAFNMALGKPISESEIERVAMILVVAAIVLCLLAAIAIAIAYSEPIRKRRVDEDIEMVDVPEHYREHFQAEEDARPRPRSDDPEATDQPPRPSARPENDRIRD